MKKLDLNNKIYLGDSNKLIKLIPDKSIDCIYTDVPYLYGNSGGGTSDLAKQINKRNNELINADITEGFNYQILDEFVRVMKKINIIIWLSKGQLQYVLNYFMNLDAKVFFEPLVWLKTNPLPQTHNVWLPDVEYAFHFREQGVALNDGYDIKSKYFISPINTKDKKLYDHPTIKPLELVKRHLEHITSPNDIVLDTFLGSGTTAVASKDLGRKYLGFEIDKNYYNISKDRLNDITQIERRKKDNGIFNMFDLIPNL